MKQKAELTTKIQLKNKTSITTISFFGNTKSNVMEKIIRHIYDCGWEFTGSEEQHFLTQGYYISPDKEVEFKVTF